MDSPALSNALSFIVAFVLMAAFAAVFAIVLYVLIARDQKDKADAITVKKGGEDLAGVPFFTKRSRWLQETTYLETLLDCTLAVTEIRQDDEGKLLSIANQFSISKIFPWSDSVTKQLTDIQKNLARVQTGSDPNKQWKMWAEEILPAFEALPSYSGEIPEDLPMIGNVAHEEVYVDYDTEFYINYKQPVIGSANVAVELSENGTLGKTSAEIADDTLSTLLATIPLKEVATSTLAVKVPKPSGKESEEGVMSSEEEELPISETAYRFELTCKQSYIKYILFREVADQDAFACIPLSDASDAKSWYRQEYATTLELEIKSLEKEDGKGDKNQ